MVEGVELRISSTPKLADSVTDRSKKANAAVEALVIASRQTQA